MEAVLLIWCVTLLHSKGFHYEIELGRVINLLIINTINNVHRTMDLSTFLSKRIINEQKVDSIDLMTGRLHLLSDLGSLLGGITK